MNICLEKCRECCKFEKGEEFFAPKITDREIARIKSSGLYKKVFKQFEESKKVFQISLIKSKFEKNLLVCHYLDEKTQKCRIYKIRPVDCEMWPFLFMRGKNNKDVFLAHFDKKMCPITEAMSQKEFKNYLDKGVKKWTRKNIIDIFREYPELVWDWQSDAFTIKKI